MKTSMFKGAFAVVALVATLGFTNKTSEMNSQTLCAGFLPENNMKIPVGLYTGGGITEQQFNDVMDRMEKIYSEEVSQAGDTLKINRLWTNATVNASAQRMGNVEVLNMYGGLARHPATTVEGMALVACHEFGHHHGGAPKLGASMGGAWATNEGGADYYATLKCLRRYFAEDDNATILNGVELDPTAVAGCNAQFDNEQDRLICLRTSMAGQSVAYLFQALRKETTLPTFGTPDRSQVGQMYDQHPQTQCRMDTYFAGMLCQSKVSEQMSNSDYREGSCYQPRDTIGFRPRCWFFPGK
ncbi:MAG: hypothetical protein ACXVCY_08305 [Pseudobdellovibrionaceae bacterium]